MLSSSLSRAQKRAIDVDNQVVVVLQKQKRESWSTSCSLTRSGQVAGGNENAVGPGSVIVQATATQYPPSYGVALSSFYDLPWFVRHWPSSPWF